MSYAGIFRLLFTGSFLLVILTLGGCSLLSSDFLPHGFCLHWDPALLFTLIAANLGIALAYFSIPLALLYFIRHRKDLPYPWMFRLFGMFIVACGLTHIMTVWTLYQPLYWPEAIIDLYTAGVSLVTAVLLWPLIPKALSLKNPEELRIANEKLAQSVVHGQKAEQKFRLLLETAPEARVILNGEGKIDLVNFQTERIFGYNRDDIIGRPIEMLIPKGIQENRVKGEVKDLLLKPTERSTVAGCELYALRKNGRKFPIDIRFSPLETEEGALIALSIRDITDQKQTMEALQAQAELLDLTHDAILVRDLDGTIRYWNRGAEEMYGFSEDEAIAHISHDLFKTEHPKSYSEIEKEILDKGRWDGELIHYSKNGRRMIVESRHSLNKDMQGKPVAILEINTDITERKEAEQKQQTMSEMARSNAELEQFASVASHDLQEPLRAVAGCLQVLEKTYKGKLDDNADELIHYAVDGAQRMRNLINDLLSLSRVNSSGWPLLRTELSHVYEEALKNLAATIAESNATITHDPLPIIMADSSQLVQLFQNLISNAIKFRDERSPEIHVGAKRQDNKWLFSISDNGIGFSQEYADKLFQPFKRLHTRDKYPGTGIGLAICKRIVERHGGTIKVESQLGKGTTFYFTLAATNEGDRDGR